jgi:arginine N-succinyltransferase
MIVVRSVQSTDVDALLALANETGPGLSTLKPDRAALAARVERVRRTFNADAELFEQGYLFVMEDTAHGDVNGGVIGVSGIETAVGLDQPFYNYRVGTVVHASKELGTWTRMSLLNISHDLTGYAELCSLFLSPRARSGGVGGLLSRARFMFVAQHRELFSEHICAEMRGYFDETGHSPFWEAVGSHFYQIDFNEADYLSTHGRKSFLAELMPRYPVYVELLPEPAQACVGLTHADTLPARRMLEAEGLRYQHHVDIFDAGPVLEAYIADLRTVRRSRMLEVRIAERALADTANGGSDAPNAARCLVSNTSLGDFRVILGHLSGSPRSIALTGEEADALRVAAGDKVRVLELPAHSQRVARSA